MPKIFYHYDPMGFVHDGVLEDECDPEARAIICRLNDLTDIRSPIIA